MQIDRNFIVLFTLLFQSLTIILINHSIISIENTESLKALLPLINLVILVILVLNIIAIKKLEIDAENRSKIQLLNKHIKDIESLNLTLQTQKHEYLRHIEEIQSLAYLDYKKQLLEYISGIAKMYRQPEQVINTGHPVITTLITSKKAAAESQGIEFAVAVKSNFANLSIPPWDINTIIGNLIDNALEAALNSDKPRVAVEFNHQNGQYRIYIVNNGSTITDAEKIFEAGYTTKDSLSRGYGMFMVKKLIDHHQGYIEVISKNKTFVNVSLPDGGLINDKYSFHADGSKLR